MNFIRVLFLVSILALGANCVRQPDAPLARLNVQIPGGGGPQQAVGLPSGFECAFLAVHLSSDTDGSHCFDGLLNEEYQVTSVQGPFQAGQVITLELPAEVVTFNLIIEQNSSNCSVASGFVGSGTAARVVLNQSVDLSSIAGSEGNVTLSITTTSGGSTSACQNVENVNI